MRTFTVDVYPNGTVLVQDDQEPWKSVLLAAESERASAVRQALGVED